MPARLSISPKLRIGEAPLGGRWRYPAWLSRPGPFETLDQGHHAVVPGRGYSCPPPLGGDAAVEDVDLGSPARQDVLQHARLVLVRLGDGLVHGLPRRARE